MTTLTEKLKSNIELLLNLNENDIIIADRGSLMKQGDYVQVDNNLEIEYALYFTFTELLGHSLIDNLNYTKYDNLIIDIDTCINNIYENVQLNKLIENDENINKIVNHIEDLFDVMKDKLFYYSPFYNIIRNMNSIYSNISKNFF